MGNFGKEHDKEYYEKRNLEIYRKRTEENRTLKELAVEFGLSLASVERIIKRMSGQQRILDSQPEDGIYFTCLSMRTKHALARVGIDTVAKLNAHVQKCNGVKVRGIGASGEKECLELLGYKQKDQRKAWTLFLKENPKDEIATVRALVLKVIEENEIQADGVDILFNKEIIAKPEES